MTAAAALAGTALSPTFARAAQSTGRAACPELAGRTVRWIVPYSPGGGYDLYSRLIEPFLEEQLGAEIRVDNVPGAGGLLGARMLHTARPDGRTVGILNGSGMIVASMLGQRQALNPAKDFSLLASLGYSPYVWAVGKQTGWRTIDELLARPPDRPVVVSMTALGSSGFVVSAVVSDLLKVPTEYVTGFAGSREATHAAIQGYVDLISYQVEAVFDRIVSGELRPLLLIGDGPVPDHPALHGVPVLGGDAPVQVTVRGVSQRFDKSNATLAALSRLMRVGRVIAGPPGFARSIRGCLQGPLEVTLTDPAFVSAAHRATLSLAVASADDTMARVAAGVAAAPTLLPVIQRTTARLRG